MTWLLTWPAPLCNWRQAIADPSAVAHKVQQQIAERQKNHEMRNQVSTVVVDRMAGTEARTA